MAPLQLRSERNLVSINFFAHNTGAGNGCAKFMGAWSFCVLSAGSLHAQKFLLLGGDFGFFGDMGVGGSADLIFMGAGIFLMRVQSWSRTRVRIAASIAFLFSAYLGVLGTIVSLSHG